ncbi:MAG: ABC transporter permease, partial [Gemmobacter sp.]
MRSLVPILTVIAAIIGVWYLAAIWMNATWVYDQAARDGREVGFSEVVGQTLNQERPVLPAPHQVAKGLW